mmetsp:Transcript_77/g.201  ORF Transcript_77/g.201 Transcript_77/m.201 type:complete len:241 (-) Transcript_77:104-826(-)
MILDRVFNWVVGSGRVRLRKVRCRALHARDDIDRRAAVERKPSHDVRLIVVDVVVHVVVVTFVWVVFFFFFKLWCWNGGRPRRRWHCRRHDCRGIFGSGERQGAGIGDTDRPLLRRKAGEEDDVFAGRRCHNRHFARHTVALGTARAVAKIRALAFGALLAEGATGDLHEEPDVAVDGAQFRDQGLARNVGRTTVELLAVTFEEDKSAVVRLGGGFHVVAADLEFPITLQLRRVGIRRRQ